MCFQCKNYSEFLMIYTFWNIFGDKTEMNTYAGLSFAFVKNQNGFQPDAIRWKPNEILPPINWSDLIDTVRRKTYWNEHFSSGLANGIH